MGDMVKRVVVTGAQGFLGRRMICRLAEEGYTVLAVDRNPPKGPNILGIDYHLSDLSDPLTLLPASWKSVDEFILIHLAWDMNRSNSAFAIQSEQVILFAALLDTWVSQGISLLVVPGSAQEFGVRNGTLREEDEPTKPLTPYGWAKRAAHILAVSWSERTGIPLLWLRPFIAYGPGQTGDMLIPYAINQACKRAPAQFSDGQQIRDFVYIDDVIDAFIKGIRMDLIGVNSANLGGNPVKVQDVLKMIETFFDTEDLFQYDATLRRKGEPEIQIADTRHAEALLGWCSSVDVSNGIRQTCKWAVHV